jgi:hypothetical protein
MGLAHRSGRGPCRGCRVNLRKLHKVTGLPVNVAWRLRGSGFGHDTF